MPRKPRRIVPGVLYHLISRFVDREWFIERERERAYYLTLLGHALASSDWTCIGYAVMSNHIHLAAIAGHVKLDTWIRRVHAPFAEYLNKEHKRIGNVFTRGPKSLPIPNDRAGQLLAYIHNNPIRAQQAASARESTWTSHRAYMGLDPAPQWLDTQRGLALADRGSLSAFDDWVADGPAHPLFGAHAPDASYEELIAAYEEQQARLRATAQPETRTVPDRLLSCAAEAAGIPTTQLLSRRRGRTEVFARAVIVRCCDTLGFESTATARALQVTPPAVFWLRKQHGVSADVLRLASEVLARFDAISVQNKSPDL